MVDWKGQILEQLDFYWPLFRARIDGLTDEEYFWEPVDGCWSMRPVPDGFAFDFTVPEPEPPPFTTIAWRLCHIAGPVFAWGASNHFGDGSYVMDNHGYPGTAAGALAYLDTQHALWRDHIGTLDEVGLAAPCGSAEGPYAERPFAELILHLNREVIHHGAEVCLLRDLYRASGGQLRVDG
ncbi:MAG: DinB family protein [Sciscionella sp.]